ncbi:MAG TPA: metal ABC transporter substrate-binding protein, partial [Verrucomicrobiae bacterium]
MKCLGLTVGLLLLAAAMSEAAPQPSSRLHVLTSFLPLYCAASNIAGDHAEVENFLSGQASPHDYQLSRRDLQKLERADLLVINGLGLESWLSKVTDARTKKGLVEGTEGLDQEVIYNSELQGERGKQQRFPNPHIWLNPVLFQREVTNILAAMQKANPSNAEVYAHNAAAYCKRLDALDQELSARLNFARDMAIVTTHNAFDYFARRYHLRLAGVIEQVPDVSPSAQHLRALREAIKAQHVVAIFSESLSPS